MNHQPVSHHLIFAGILTLIFLVAGTYLGVQPALARLDVTQESATAPIDQGESPHNDIVFARHSVVSGFDGAISAQSVDLDDDGDMDVVGAAYYGNIIAWWENDGNESFTQHTIAQGFTGPYMVVAVDLDGDGDKDVLGAGRQSRLVSWWENDGERRFTGHVIDNNLGQVASVSAADMDGDGDIDVLACDADESDPDKVAWYENDGNEHFTRHIVEGDFDAAWDVGAADVDGDSDKDIFAAAGDADTVAWWENDGKQNFTRHIVDGAFDGASSMLVTDVDSDGDMDVVATAFVADDLAWYENDGDQSFTKHIVDGGFDGVHFVDTADLDGDGDLDLLASATNANSIAWWENDGSESFTKHVITDNFARPYAISAADIDADGHLDVLAVAHYGDAIAWWENTSDGRVYIISGHVTEAAGNPLAGVTVSTGARSTITNSSGYYALILPAGPYTLTPSRAGYTFAPASRSVTVPPDATGQDFVGTPLPLKLRLLYVPLRWEGSQASFDAEARTQSGTFIDDVPLKGCQDRVSVETLNVATQNYDTFACSANNCGVGSVRAFVMDELEIDPTDYDVIVGLAESSPCTPTAGCSNGTDTIWVTAEYDSVTAHELGHIYGLEEQYCSNQAGSTDSRCNDGDSQGDGATTGDLNWLDASLPCDCPPDGSNDSGGSACCNFGGHSCSTVNYGACCQGNKNSAGGRSTMSYANAADPRGFDSHDKAHLNTLPQLNCASTSRATGFAPKWLVEEVSQTILDVNLRVHQNNGVDEVSISLTEGRPTPASVLQGMTGDYSLEISRAGGGMLWTQAFPLYFDYTGPVVLGADYSGLNYDEVAVEFRIPFRCGMSEVSLYHSGRLIFSRTLSYKCLFLPLILRGQ